MYSKWVYVLVLPNIGRRNVAAVFILSTFPVHDVELKKTRCVSCRLINPLSTKLYLYNLKTQFVPRSKHSASAIKTDKFMLYRGKIAICSEIQAKHINALWAEQRISEC